MEVLSMNKQFGCSAFLLTLSCANLRLNYLAEVQVDDIENINYFERCSLLNRTPALAARYFQDHVQVFFRDYPA